MSWRLVSIKDLSEQVQSWNPAKTNNDESTFVYVDLSAVDKNKKEIDLSNVQNITPKDAPSRARQIVKKHDVLVSTVRPNLNGVALVPSILDGATASTGYCVIRVNEERLNPKFLYHWLQTDLFVSDMISKATGANYPAVSDRLIKESKIPLPPLAEQKRIADILDKADGIRRKRQQAIDLTDEFLRAIFLDMFGDPVTNPKKWDVKPLREVVINLDSNRVPVKKADRSDMDGDYPYYGASGIIDYVDSFLFEKRNLLIGEDGANLLARSTPIAFIADGKYWVNNHAHVLGEKDGFSLDYLRYSINLRPLNKYVTGSAQPKLNKENLNKIPIQIPGKDLMEKFEEILKKQELMKEKVLIASELHLFESLSQKAFSGELN